MKEGVIQFDVDFTTGDAEVFEFAADPGDVAFSLIGVMFRIETRHDAIDGENVEHVQAFEHGGRERVMRIVVGLVATGHVRIAILEGNEAAKFEGIDARVAMTADYRQGTLRLNVDLMMKRPSEVCTKRVSTRVEMERTGRLRGHAYHLWK